MYKNTKIVQKYEKIPKKFYCVTDSSVSLVFYGKTLSVSSYEVPWKLCWPASSCENSQTWMRGRQGSLVQGDIQELRR